MTGVTHPRQPARRRTRLATTWWGKAWVRAVEEWAFTERDLVASRALARSGRIGSITVARGECVAAVATETDLWPVRLTVPTFDRHEVDALLEVVAAEAGRIASLLAGDLPHALAEEAEESGAELLPYGGEFGGSCGCPDWSEPCVHALAVAQQVAWLVDEDPFVLLHLRGLAKETLLAGVHDREPVAADPVDDDLAVALDAASRAARMLELLADPEGSVDHLW